jgi:hypothetical protein
MLTLYNSTVRPAKCDGWHFIIALLAQLSVDGWHFRIALSTQLSVDVWHFRIAVLPLLSVMIDTL